MKNKKYILGAGIAGLIANFYNKDYTIISDNIGGKLSNKFMKNIIYLHDTPENEKLLVDLEFPIIKKTHVIKYIKNNTIIENVTMLDKLNLIRKKVNIVDYEPIDYNLSVNDFYIATLDVDFDKLIEKLSLSANIIREKIIRINENEIITENQRYEYEDIISTINAKVFWKLYNKENKILELENKVVTFVLSDMQPKVLDNVRYNLCYFIDEEHRYTRVSVLNNKFLYEFTGEYNEKDIKSMLPKNAKILDLFVDPYGIVLTNVNNIPPNNIKFISRFATWNHSHKIQDVIKEVTWNYDFSNIWNRQKSFSSKIIDFNKLKDAKEKEKLTQTFILHLLEELGEILSLINYKLHKREKEIDIDKIKEEAMDIFKYILNIFLIWDVDVKEFVNLFNFKSAICEQRLEKEKQ